MIILRNDMNYKYIPLYVQGNNFNGMYWNPWTMQNSRDVEYVKEMYPETFDRIQEIVEQEADRQEFVGSMMYDEYPDKMGLLSIVNRIFDKLKKEEVECKEPSGCIEYPDDKWLKDIIMVLLLNEIYRRRQKRKRYY